MLKIRDTTDYLDYDTKKCCDHPDISETEFDNEIVCKNCGTVLSKIYENLPRRIYTIDDQKARKTNEPVYNRYHCRTVFNPIEKCRKQSNDDLEHTKHSKFQRLYRIQTSYTDNFSRNMILIDPIFKQIKFDLNIPIYIIDQAKRFYCIAVKRSIIKGRSINAFIFASLYISVRLSKYPLTYDKILESYINCIEPIIKDNQRPEISSESKHPITHVKTNKQEKNVYRRIISRSCRVLIPFLQREFPSLKFTLAIDPSQIISLTANILNIPQFHTNHTIKILSILQNKGFGIGGNNPKGIAIALLYLTLKNNSYGITQSQLAKIGLVTEVTVRNVMKKILAFMNKKKITNILSFSTHL